MSERSLVRGFLIFLLFLGGAVCGNCWGSIAHSEPRAVSTAVAVCGEESVSVELVTGPALVTEKSPAPTGVEIFAALLLARYGANEAGLDARADLAMIWQVAGTHADDVEGRVRWLRRHSRCVVTEEPPATWPPGNCRWARFLTIEGSSPPQNWPGAAEAWAQVEPAWDDLFAFALRLVRGLEIVLPCAGHPQTWDGRRWMDERLAEGYIEIPCFDPFTTGELANVAYRYPHWRVTAERRRARASTLALSLAPETPALMAAQPADAPGGS